MKRGAGVKRRGVARRIVVGTAAALALAAIGVLVLRQPWGARPPAFGEDYDEALRLSSQGRHVASLPHYARAAHDMSRVWVFHFNYSSALYNAALEVKERLAAVTPQNRSSIERVRLLDRSLEEITAAESLALSTTDRATVMLARAQMMQIWGLGWDAMGPLDGAHRLDASVEHGMAAAQFALMRHPEIADSVAR